MAAEPALAARPPRRPRALHALALGAALPSALLLAGLLAMPWPAAVAGQAGVADLAMSAGFVLEFLTRSGLRWRGLRYLPGHWFDAVAMIPAGWLLAGPWAPPAPWAWLVLLARVARVVDRALGDFWLESRVMLLVHAVEEEITDRVLLRIMARVERELEDGELGRAVARALAENKQPLLLRLRATQADGGALSALAQAAGLTALVERGEERVFDAIVEVVGSEEVDRALRDTIAQSFDNARREIARKEWRARLSAEPRG